MKLAAIYNVWDGVELIRGSMDCLKHNVNEFIIVYQAISNYDEVYNPLEDIKTEVAGLSNIHFIEYKPSIESSGTFNERRKRYKGLEYAKKLGCTHFMHIDVDEYYEDFGAAKNAFIQSGLRGSVCRLYTYFKEPTLRLEIPEQYFVPFIHELKPKTQWTNDYPFRVDPTRRVNETKVGILEGVWMHHFSWIRKDIMRKVRNSSARKAMEKSNHLTDWQNAKPGYFATCENSRLIEVPNIFNIQI